MKSNDTPHPESWKAILVFPAKTTIAVLLALLVAQLFGLPEFYWAPISALIVVMQSSLGSSITKSWQLLAGTALGACIGSLLAVFFGPSVIGFGLAVFGIGLLSAVLRFDPAALRFALVALIIVLFAGVPHEAWDRAFHRFAEFAVGIVVGLIVNALWPQSLTNLARAADKNPRP
jgi:uncharacterized membrane protein YgaE (UPF0421/DUF939 family)